VPRGKRDYVPERETVENALRRAARPSSRFLRLSGILSRSKNKSSCQSTHDGLPHFRKTTSGNVDGNMRSPSWGRHRNRDFVIARPDVDLSSIDQRPSHSMDIRFRLRICESAIGKP